MVVTCAVVFVCVTHRNTRDLVILLFDFFFFCLPTFDAVGLLQYCMGFCFAPSPQSSSEDFVFSHHPTAIAISPNAKTQQKKDSVIPVPLFFHRIQYFPFLLCVFV